MEIIHLLIEYLFGFSLYCFATKLTTPVVIMNDPIVSRDEKQFGKRDAENENETLNNWSNEKNATFTELTETF